MLILGISANDILSPVYLDRIVERLIRQPGLKVRVLLLDPDSPVAAIRSKAVAYVKHDGLKLKFNAVMIELEAAQSELEERGVKRERLDVKLLSKAPVVSSVLNEHTGVVSFLFEHITGGRAPFLQCVDGQTSSGLHAHLRTNFEALWKSPTP